jgi:hypothetical protein
MIFPTTTAAISWMVVNSAAALTRAIPAMANFQIPPRGGIPSRKRRAHPGVEHILVQSPGIFDHSDAGRNALDSMFLFPVNLE